MTINYNTYQCIVLTLKHLKCFTAARLGEVCYSNAHCALSGEKNKCEFTIPGVFGFCVCDSAIRDDCPLRGQDLTLIKPNNSAFKYPFSKPDLKKKVPFLKRPWQSNDQQHTTNTTTSTTTVKPIRPADKLHMPPLKRPILKTNLTSNNIKNVAIPITSTQSSLVFLNSTTPLLKNITLKPQVSSVPTPSPIKVYLKSPLKDSQNISQTIDNKTSIKTQKKPIGSTGKSSSKLIIIIIIFVITH